MAENRGTSYIGSFFVGGMIVSWWFIWGIIVADNEKKTGWDIFGIVLFCLLLAILTIALLDSILLFAIVIPLIPIGLAYGLVILISSLIQLLLSPICIVRPRFSWKPATGVNYCRLCEKCQAMVGRSSILTGTPWMLTWSAEYHDFYSWSEFVKSAQGCHLCTLLLDSIDASNRNELSKQSNLETNDEPIDEHVALLWSEVASGQNQNSSSYGAILRSKINRSKGMKVKIWVDRHLLADPEMRMKIHHQNVNNLKSLIINKQPSKFFIHRCFESIYTDSSDILYWSKRWVTDCIKNHESCRNEFVGSSSKNYLPLRLLNLENWTDGTISLVSTGDLKLEEDVTYSALSHCWGGKVDVRLTKTNQDEMRNIQIQSLPKNFQDAIAATRKLGMRYLWIDSLCIVQNNDEEWHSESKNMGLIYANAKCVISATASKDANGGCFLPRDLRYNNCVVHNSPKEDAVLVVHASKEPPKLEALFKQKVDEAPLTRRGWTFQERYLASRVVHFCDGHILFECQKLMASEHNTIGQEYSTKRCIRFDGKLHSTSDCNESAAYFPQYRPSSPNMRGAMLSKQRRAAERSWERRRKVNPQYLAQQEKRKAMLRDSARFGLRGSLDFLWRFSGHSMKEKVEFHNAWFDLIEEYSARQLTRGSDKAMAIAGIASIIQQKNNFEYAVGMWKETLSFNLLWLAVDGTHARPARGIPTWSWASVNGHISHELKSRRPSYDGKQANSWYFQSPWPSVDSLISEETFLDSEAINDSIRNPTLRLKGQLLDFNESDFNIKFDTSDYLEGDKLVCLPIILFHNQAHLRVSQPQVQGIVLRAKEEGSIYYERVAFFSTTTLSIVKAVSDMSGPDSTVYIM